MKRITVGLVVSLFFLYLVLRQINFASLGIALKEANYFLVFLAVAFHSIGFYLRTRRWQYLLQSLKKVTTTKLFPYLALGYMANNVLFLRLGEVVRAHVTGRHLEISRSSMLAVIFSERLYDGLSLVFGFGVLLLFLPLSPDLKTPLQLATLLFGVGAVGVFLLPYLEKTKLLKNIFGLIEKQPRLNRPFHSLMAFLEGLKTLKSLRQIWLVFALSLTIWLIEGGMFYLIGLSFPVPISLAQATVTALVVGLSTLIPSGPGYVGTYEFFFVQTVMYFGVDRNLAVSYAFLTHFAQWLPITIVGFYYSLKMNVSVLKLKENKK